MSQAQSMQTEAERIFESAADALSDDIVGRLGTTMGDGLMLLDQVSRSELDKAIPLINRLVETGDLEKIVGLARVLGSAGDALSDDIIGRLGQTLNDLLCLADRIARNENLNKLMDLLERDQFVETLTSLYEAVAMAKADNASQSLGGIGGFIKVIKDPETQQALQFISKFSSTFKSAK